MDLFAMTALAAVLLAAAGYAHLRIPRHTKGTLNIALAPAILILAGIASGYVAALIYWAEPRIALLGFLVGFRRSPLISLTRSPHRRSSDSRKRKKAPTKRCTSNRLRG